MKVLLLGRTTRNKTGGLGRSAQLIKASLEAVGNQVEIRNVRAPLTDVPAGTTLMWHYGDVDHIEQQVAKAFAHGLPVLINSAWDNTGSSVDRILETWKRLSYAERVFFVTFTHAAEEALTSAMFFYKGPAPRFLAIPKTIRPTVRNAQFAARSGVCIGELEKLNRPRLLGITPDMVVSALREEGIDEIYAYDQYGTKDTQPIPGVKVVPREHEGRKFLDWLGGLRLFVSLSSHETFAMVPCEAQAQGTPVLYMHQPQSHTEHFGFTGARFSHMEELLQLAHRLYRDEAVWKAMSLAGIHNAAARGGSHETMGAQLTLALERFLARV